MFSMHGTLVLSGVLMKEALIAYDNGEWAVMRSPRGASEFPTFRNAPEEVLGAVREKLSEEEYSHYVD